MNPDIANDLRPLVAERVDRNVSLAAGALPHSSPFAAYQVAGKKSGGYGDIHKDFVRPENERTANAHEERQNDRAIYPVKANGIEKPASAASWHIASLGGNRGYHAYWFSGACYIMRNLQRGRNHHANHAELDIQFRSSEREGGP